MNFGYVKEPVNEYLNEEGTFDLMITECKAEWKNGKESYQYYAISRDSKKTNFSLYPGNEWGKWHMKKLLLVTGYSEEELKSIDVSAMTFVGGVFRCKIVKEDYNGKFYHKPDPKTFEKSNLKPSDFEQSSEEPF